MNREKQREIASKGGRAAHQKGTAHEFSSDEAREAGRKGGQAVSRNREHMAAIGRKGGMESGARARKSNPEDDASQGNNQGQQPQNMGGNPGQDQGNTGGQPMGNNPM
jgi:general stress protein YciG